MDSNFHWKGEFRNASEVLTNPDCSTSCSYLSDRVSITESTHDFRSPPQCDWGIHRRLFVDSDSMKPISASHYYCTSELPECYRMSASRDLRTLRNCRSDFHLLNFRDLQYVCDGSSSNIFVGVFCENGETVILKIIKESSMHDPVAVKEFEDEFATLCCLEHPNIVRVLGAGSAPRMFIVLECLDGGSLSFVQSSYKSSTSFLRRKVFGRSPFTFNEVLMHAKNLASAMQYLHSEVHPGVSVIHRDLKADNIGFTADGVLKVFDFGLCTCVRKNTESDNAFKLTGRTGSLRFMAPEVAQSLPYSEKVDVYSFGILLWQMAKGHAFNKSMKWSDFMKDVVINGERPKLDRAWPPSFCCLLESCWTTNPFLRPSFADVLRQLDALIAETCVSTVSSHSSQDPPPPIAIVPPPSRRPMKNVGESPRRVHASVSHTEIVRASERHYVSAPEYSEMRSGWF